MTASAPLDDSAFAEAVRKAAPRQFDVWSKLLEGAQAQAALAVREREEMAAELAEIKQRESKQMYDARYFWGNFYKVVYYGHPSWPSYSYWIVPGTIDLDKI